MVEAIEAAVFVGMFIAGLIMPIYIYAKYYVRVPPNKAFVVYGGKQAGATDFRVITGGSLFLRPLLDSYEVLSLEPVQVVAEWDLLTKDGREVRVEVLGNVTVGNTKEMLDRAARSILGKDPEEIRKTSSNVIEGQARTLAVGHSHNQLKFDRASFAASLQEHATKALAAQGLEVRDLQVNEVGEPFHREEVLDRIRDLTERVGALEKRLPKV